MSQEGIRVYVGGLDVAIQERELEDEISKACGGKHSIWLARNPPGFAFITFDDIRDAEDAVRDLNGKHGWRVEMARPRRTDRGGGFDGGRGGGGPGACYQCGQPGHIARECPGGGRAGGYGGGGGGYGGGGGGYGGGGGGGYAGGGGGRYEDRGGSGYDRRDRDPADRGDRRERSPPARRDREHSPVGDRRGGRGSPAYE